jgi:hypothetical protein
MPVSPPSGNQLTQEAANELQWMIRAQITECQYVPKSFVYVLVGECDEECGNGHLWIKVGRSIDPQKRVTEVVRGGVVVPNCIEGISLEYVIPGAAKTERHLRNFLKHWMPVTDSMGEWLQFPSGEVDETPDGVEQELEDVLVLGFGALWRPFWSSILRLGVEEPFRPEFATSVEWVRSVHEEGIHGQFFGQEVVA